MNSEYVGMPQSETIHQSLFEHFADGICLINCDRPTIVNINPAGQRLLGYLPTDLQDQDFRQIIASPPERVQQFTQVYRNPDCNLGELQLRCKNGTLVGVEVRSSLLAHPTQSLICLILRPVDESTSLKESFLSTISHELSTPISTIKLAIEMLTVALSREGFFMAESNSPSSPSKKVSHYLKILSDECDRQIGLISDLLNLQKLEAGLQNPTSQPIHLQSHLLRIVRPFEEQAKRRQQVVNVEIFTDLPIVTSDAQSLERILVELLTNACKYSPPGASINVMAHDLPSTDTTPPLVMISVINSGVEISTDYLGKIFNKFYRIPSQDPNKYGGTGLGLALVRKLALSMGGKVRAESGAGQTCFTVEIPVNASAAIAMLPESLPAPVG
jgi:PAS domain S-box-containing protein